MDLRLVHGMFFNVVFNQPIGDWDVSNVTDMSGMFDGSTFNGDISNWDVSNVTNMSYMFSESSFNGVISNWDVSSVTNMGEMFENSKFDGDVSKWVNPVINNNKSFCKKVAMDYLNNLNLSNIYWLSDLGYKWGTCQGNDLSDFSTIADKPNQYQYCGRVQKFHNGQYWSYDIVVFIEQDYNGECKATGTWDNLNGNGFELTQL